MHVGRSKAYRDTHGCSEPPTVGWRRQERVHPRAWVGYGGNPQEAYRTKRVDESRRTRRRARGVLHDAEPRRWDHGGYTVSSSDSRRAKRRHSNPGMAARIEPENGVARRLPAAWVACPARDVKA